MVRKKRAYKPKVKGCYQCSQRRVDCDGTRPACRKCSSRGISCSGFELRYKFLDGLAGGRRALRRPACPQNSRREDGPGSAAGDVWLPELVFAEPCKEFFMTYFSNHIAPEMVVLDDCHNGWRSLVLPLAYNDDLIMSAVLAVAATHLRRVADASCGADKLYGRAIRALQARRNLDECDAQTKQLVVLAIVVLLVAVMVNGCPDFPIMFQMLESALDAIGGEEGLVGGELAAFSLRQIRKMRVYAAPFLSPDAGLYAVSCQAAKSFDCLRYYQELHPDHFATLELIATLRQQSFNIYLDRVLSEGAHIDGPAMDDFVAKIQSFPDASPGKHVLVWPAFIAAMESKKPEHRRFFQGFLEEQHLRNGFGNLVEALQLLRRVWARESPEGWPALLPEPQVFIM